MPVSPARAAAFDILLSVERESSYAADLLHSPAHERLSTPDHALATELVMGVLRWRSRLDADIATTSSQRLANSISKFSLPCALLSTNSSGSIVSRSARLSTKVS